MSRERLSKITLSSNLEDLSVAKDANDNPDIAAWKHGEARLQHYAKNIFIVASVVASVLLVGSYMLNLVLPSSVRWLKPSDMGQ